MMQDPRLLVTMLSVLMLASCASVAPGPQRVLPPMNLLQDCHEPSGTTRTNGELAAYAQRLRDALRGCNRDKESLRQWADS